MGLLLWCAGILVPVENEGFIMTMPAVSTTLAPSRGVVPHDRIAATGAVVLRLKRRGLRGIHLSAAEVAALVDGPAMRAVLCEECRTCRCCGCIDAFACSSADGTGCHWVEPDLCSGCAPRGEAAR